MFFRQFRHPPQEIEKAALLLSEIGLFGGSGGSGGSGDLGKTDFLDHDDPEKRD